MARILSIGLIPAGAIAYAMGVKAAGTLNGESIVGVKLLIAGDVADVADVADVIHANPRTIGQQYCSDCGAGLRPGASTCAIT